MIRVKDLVLTLGPQGMEELGVKKRDNGEEKEEQKEE